MRSNPVVLLRALLVATVIAVPASRAAPPVYDHVVIVFEENHNYQEIIGNAAEAPFFNQLAAGGVVMTDFYGITHPSQPNYLNFFAGDGLGVEDNAKPLGRPFSAPNLAAALRAGGYSFTGFAEDLPAPGDAETEATIHPEFGSVVYARKHVPWTNWQDATLPTPPNRLPPTTNLPFAFFPTDFNELPTVAIVTPNQLNDMHDGTVEMADAWLRTNLGAYAEWARTHNSLLIVTWDEDSFQSRNQIPTIFYGAHLRRGEQPATGTLHNLLRTVVETYGLPPMGAAARVAPIPGIFANEPATRTFTFRQGLGNYAGARDTQLRQDQPTAGFAAAPLLGASLDDDTAADGAREVQSLVRFEDLFGPGAIPAGAQVLSAKLLLTTGGLSDNESFTGVQLHRMLAPWNDNATWSSLNDGVSADGVEAAAEAEFTATPNVGSVPGVFDVTSSVQAFGNGEPNRGWVLLATSDDGWFWSSSEEPDAVRRPTLTVTVAANAVEFSQPHFTVREDGISASLTVTRTADAPGAVSVAYATQDGTAQAGADYAGTSGTLTWAAGDATPRTITVPVTADALAEGLESFRVALSNPTGLAVLGANASVPVFITERPFDDWRVQHFGEAADGPDARPTADPDLDGSNNLHEYAFATDPRAAASHFTPVVMDGTHLTIAFPRPLAATDLTYTVQVSENLTTWLDGSRYSAAGDIPSNVNTTQISRTGSPVETIVVRDNTPCANAARRFIRVKVTQP